MAGFPSVLALRDLRRRVRQALAPDRLTREATVQLLEIDPLTLVRCMRFLHAPVHDMPGVVFGIPDLVDRVGLAFIKRAFCNPSVHPASSRPLREMWLFALAKGVAARMLTVESYRLTPDQAFILGVLGDLDRWSVVLAQWRGQRAQPLEASRWIGHWNLPLMVARNTDSTQPGGSLAGQLGRAGELACIAGFPPPEAEGFESRKPGMASMEDLVLANRVKTMVTQMLRRFDLEPQVEPLPDGLHPRPAEEDVLFGNKTVGRMSDLVLNLGACQQSEHSRGILTVTTSSALRYLDFDRAYAVRWTRGSPRCWVRQKADLTPTPLCLNQIELSQVEQDVFASALTSGEPALLTANPDERDGLMGMFGSDSALVLPLNASFQMSTLLLLDRAVSSTVVDLRRDRSLGKALSIMSSLLQENLLLTRQRARAMKFALTDPLTRLHNRGVGMMALRQEIARSNRAGEPLTVLMLDLDRFKDLNDEYGHLVGDQALRTAAEVLRKVMRKSDIVARFGGEEFLVVLPGTSVEDASITASRLHAAIEIAGDELGLPLTASIGIATFERGEDTVESLLSRADRALYASKSRGRNRFSVDIQETTL